MSLVIDALIAGKSGSGDVSLPDHAAAQRQIAEWRRELERLFGRPKLDFVSSEVSITDWTPPNMHGRRVHLRLWLSGSVASWRLQLRPVIRKDWGSN